MRTTEKQKAGAEMLLEYEKARALNLNNKQDQETITKIFLVALELSKLHYQRHFSYRGTWHKGSQKIESLCQTVYERHIFAFERTRKVFDFLLGIGAIKEVEPYLHIKTENNEKWSNEFATYTSVRLTRVRMFAFSEAVMCHEDYELIEKQANMYDSGEKGIRAAAIQLKTVAVLPILQCLAGQASLNTTLPQNPKG